MTTDSLTAYRIDDGSKIWRTYTDGPMRLAPAAWNGRVYAVSDDGHLYCMDGATGELIWKFRAAPDRRAVLGNTRVISMWAARGAPVIKDGIVYFAAGVWPLMGTFIFALNAETGDVIWRNTGDYADFQVQPHNNAYAFAGISPQGYLAVSGDRLVVSGGRSLPALLDRHTGKILRLHIYGRGPGGYQVQADDEYFYNHGRRYSLSDGSRSGGGRIDNALRSRAEALADKLDAPIFEVLAAHGRLFVTTRAGTLYAFGQDEQASPTRHTYNPSLPPARNSDDPHQTAILEAAAAAGKGYALVLGAGDGDLMEQLALHSDLHIVGIETDEVRRDTLRRRFDAAGLYGKRIALLSHSASALQYPPYISSLIVVPDLAEVDLTRAQVYKLLRPYGGKAFIGSDDVVTRDGPLPGSGQWTHQHADAARTMASFDDRVRLPLGILWYGGVTNENVLPRHATGTRPQVAGGRLAILGVETLSARDVYTGRELWVREFPGIGHPFTNLELEAEWTDGGTIRIPKIPGAAYIGSPFVTLPDSIYLRYRGSVLKLDPATGDTLAEFPLYPDDADNLQHDWGHMSIVDDLLITTTAADHFDDTELGWFESWNATSSRRLVVMDRFSGEILWHRKADIGFRHNAIVAGNGRLFVIDGLSKQALEFLARRGDTPDAPSRVIALDAANGSVIWENDSAVFGTYLAYSKSHELLLESGIRDTTRSPLPDEPVSRAVARCAKSGDLRWEAAIEFPAAIVGQRIIPARPDALYDLLTGEVIQAPHPITGESSRQHYRKDHGCGPMNASNHLILFRSGSAGYSDLEFASATGTLGGFRSGCTASMIAADGVLNAPDYTRTCVCSYQNQTSLGLIHMPDADVWTSVWVDRGEGPMQKMGINLGAPGNRRADDGTLWTPFPPVDAPSPELPIRVHTVEYGAPVRVNNVTSNFRRGDWPQATLDGDDSTHARARSNRNRRFRRWLNYELSEPVSIDKVQVAWEAPKDTEFSIETSLDGSDWTTVLAKKTDGTAGELHTYEFEAVTSRYVRLHLADHADSSRVARARVYHVRIGDLPFPQAYGYFIPKQLFRHHPLEFDSPDGMQWVTATGVYGLDELIVEDIRGGGAPYEVTLHFVEPDGLGTGERVFDIYLQGDRVASGFDPASQAGAAGRAFAVTFSQVQIDDSLRVELRQAENSLHPPLLCGLRIERE